MYLKFLHGVNAQYKSNGSGASNRWNNFTHDLKHALWMRHKTSMGFIKG